MKTRNILLVATLVCSVVAIAHAQILTSTPNSNFVTTNTSRDIALTGGNAWNLDLSTGSAANMNINSIVGYYGDGLSDTGYYINGAGSIGLSGNQLIGGENTDGGTGTFIWHFVLAPGQTTAGGTIVASVGLRGIPLGDVNQFMGWSTVFTPSDGPAYSNYNYADFTKTYFSSTSPDFGSYFETFNITLPAGLTNFYVALSDNGSGGRIGLNSMQVNIATVPEPSVLALFGLAAGSVFLAKRRLKKVA